MHHCVQLEDLLLRLLDTCSRLSDPRATGSVPGQPLCCPAFCPGKGKGACSPRSAAVTVPAAGIIRCLLGCFPASGPRPRTRLRTQGAGWPFPSGRGAVEWSLWTVCSVALCFGKIQAGGQEGEEGVWRRGWPWPPGDTWEGGWPLTQAGGHFQLPVTAPGLASMLSWHPWPLGPRAQETAFLWVQRCCVWSVDLRER